MAKKKIGVVGFFGRNSNRSGGQEAKTCTLTNFLCQELGEDEVRIVDTNNWKCHPFRLFVKIFRMAMTCKNIVILPAQNGIRLFVPIFGFLRFFFRYRLHYAVVGGWLAGYLDGKKSLERKLKKFTGIYAETNTMKKALEMRGFQNVTVMPNCKQLKVLTAEEMPDLRKEPYRLCTFSRIKQEKGIGDACEAVKAVNEKLGRTVYTLDIYGPVDSYQTQWFEQLQSTFPDYIRYGDCVPFDKSVEVLQNYFALLFPTQYFTEGIPGTIIDAYAAGVPVISARWESFSDLVDEGSTGYGYEFGSVQALTEQLELAAKTPERILKLKETCLERSREYLPENAIAVLLRNIEESSL